MSLLRADRGSVAIRRAMIRDTLAEHPWSTARMIADRVLKETGGAPALLTGALYMPPWTVYTDLQALERCGAVERCQINSRVVFWRASPLTEPEAESLDGEGVNGA